MESLQQFVENYYARFAEALAAFDKAPMQAVFGVMRQVADAGGTLWVAGNGGSAAIADHTVCDATKWPYTPGKPVLRAVSLAANGPMLTALGNDFSYEEVFSKQVEYYAAAGDALLLISASGNSPNVLRACVAAQKRGLPVCAFTGFGGGKLAQMADHCVHVPVQNYGMAEDAHQSIMHALTQYLAAHNRGEL